MLQLAQQKGFSLQKKLGPILDGYQGQYQLIQWSRNQVVLGKRFDASLEQIKPISATTLQSFWNDM